MKTALGLREYDDVLDPADIYSLLGKSAIKTALGLREYEDELDPADIYSLLGKSAMKTALGLREYGVFWTQQTSIHC
ncbi:hypothetical protein DPMN_069115 [Dreissena polymorpha]|uniref:Uncharacterized protein n=1 Tax=Dreissena polymorpha TaxID=45954 RepID=A0A9D4BUR2_DREPO|nr:hypothetical protein DPMN_069115 [Dreissena polymorpha]